MNCSTTPNQDPAEERQITHGPGGRILTNSGVWSPDSQWIVYDTRSDPAGDLFDADTIERVSITTGEVAGCYRSRSGAHCGVPTFHPREMKVVFILGPENPTPDWQYAAWHRRGVIVDLADNRAFNLDARDVTPPFTPGALRGGSHVHMWDARGERVSFTYEDHVLAQRNQPAPGGDVNQRNIGVSVPGSPVKVSKDSPRNHDGEYFTVLVTHTVPTPLKGSDEIKRAWEEAWVGTNGYVRRDGTQVAHALAFQGQVVTADGQTISEVFLVDLPKDLTRPEAGPLCGTETRAPFPPKGVSQRRLTFTADRKFPGIQGPRHWLRSAPDGSRIAFLMKDDSGIVQFWTVSPTGGDPQQLTRNAFPVGSAFTWSPDGRFLAHTMDNTVCITDARSGKTSRLTPRSNDGSALRPEACVFSPDGRKIAFVRRISSEEGVYNQICVLFLRPS